MKVFITGGGGVLGSHIAELLIKQGHEVTLLIHRDTKVRNIEGAGIVYADITKTASLGGFPQDFDMVIHAAAVSRVGTGEENPSYCIEVNVIGTMNIADWCLKSADHPHLIFLSSREVYGNPSHLPVKEDHPLNPLSVYGISKAAAEMILKNRALSGLKFTILRLTNIYGSLRDYPTRVIPSFALRALKGETLIIYGGEQLLDFCHLSDLLNAVSILTKKYEEDKDFLDGKVYNICSGEGYKLKNVAKIVIETTNSSSSMQFLMPRPYETKAFIGDHSRISIDLGFYPEVSFREGIKKYVDELKLSVARDNFNSP